MTVTDLPALNATLNAISGVLLVTGYAFIRRKQWRAHRACMLSLIPHVILAALMVPPVLITVSRGLSGKYDKHRRIARWTLPVWLFVSVTGVIVYLMLYQM